MLALMKRFAFVLLVVGLGACAGGQAPAASSTPEKPCAAEGHVSGARAKSMVKDGAVLLDVRTPEEWGQEHIPGAVNIPVDDIDGRASELSKDKPVVTYCKSGMRAHRAAGALRAKGFTVYELGGIGDWDTTDC